MFFILAVVVNIKDVKFAEEINAPSPSFCNPTFFMTRCCS